MQIKGGYGVCKIIEDGKACSVVVGESLGRQGVD